jgi:cell division protein FtsN
MNTWGTRLAAAVACAVAVAGCSVQRVGLKDPAATGGTTQSGYDPQAERASPPAPAVDAAPGSSEPPPTLDTPQAANFGSPRVQVQDLDAPPAPAAAPGAPPAPAPAGAPAAAAGSAGGGYSVQVFAGTNAADAEAVRADVEARVRARAVVVYQAPHYKVRVGSCPTSADCGDLQVRLRDAGFNNLWVVSDDGGR